MRTISAALLVLTIASGAGALDVGSAIIQPAQNLIGIPYLHRGASPSGFDCSGLVYYLYRPQLRTLPRTSAAMHRYARAVTVDEAAPGDLMFFETMGTGAGISHVAIYVGDNRVIHAVSNGPETGVVVSLINTGYWKRTLYSAGRILPTDALVADDAVAPVPAPAEAARAWETYDGPVYGDFEAWRQQEKDAFEEFKRKEREGSR